MGRAPISDQQVDEIIGALLRYGVILSAAVVALGGVAGFQCRGIIQFGLVLLIATPVARVAFSVAAFALQRDNTYVAITLIVLAVLLFSLLIMH